MLNSDGLTRGEGGEDWLADLVGADIVASHEAGHALVAVVLKWTVELVEISPGRTLCRPPLSGGDVEAQRLQIAAAGRAADVLERGTEHPWSFADLGICFELAADLLTPGETVKDRVEVAVAASTAIIQQRRSAHRAVAAALCESGRLTGEELRQVVAAGGRTSPKCHPSPHPQMS